MEDRWKVLPKIVKRLKDLGLFTAQALILWQLHVGVLEPLHPLQLLLSLRLLELSILALHLVVEHIASRVGLALLYLKVHGR